MDHNDVRRYWNANAEVWTRLSRAGYDVYRDHLNTPAFLDMLPDVDGLDGLDVGCGEGANTRLLAQRGARMAAVDIADVFIRHARQSETRAPSGIRYAVASAVDLPYACASFDFVAAFMSLMDVPETESAIGEVFRVLKPGGFLQFSIMHPCYDTAHRRNLRDVDGRTYAYEVGGYFDGLRGQVDEWMFSAVPPEERSALPPFRIPRFTRTLSRWINLLLDTGFTLERLGEPRPDDQMVEAHPNIQDAQVVAYFLILRARKPILNTGRSQSSSRKRSL